MWSKIFELYHKRNYLPRVFELHYFCKKMQNLIEYLFHKYIISDSSILTTELCKPKPILLSSSLKLSQEDLHLLQYLISKNIVTYFPTQLTITLNSKMVLIYQRLYKLKRFAQVHYHPQFHQLLDKFVANEFLPVAFPEKGLKMLAGFQPNKTHSESKSKKKKEEPQQIHNKLNLTIDYSRLFYQYSTKQDKQSEGQNQIMVNLDELMEQLKYWNLENFLGKERAEEFKRQLKTEDKRELYIEMYHISKQNSGNRVELLRKTISKIKHEKIEEFILQIFRKYDGESSINQKLSSNCLLTFNLIKRFPLISEKQLIGHSLLSLVLQRKCLNLLIQQGFIHFYPEGPRSLVYRIRQYDQLEQLFIDKLSQSLLNIHILSQSPLQKQQLLKLQCMVSDLDDILILF